MKFKIFEEIIVFPEMKKDRVISSYEDLINEFYGLERKGCAVSSCSLVSQDDLRNDIKAISDTLFSLSSPVQQALINLGLIKFLIRADGALCEELGDENWKR